MKKLIILVLISCPLAAWATINFEKSSWKEVVAKATKENKIIFVDLYAVWCGPCKWIEKNVFTDASVGAYYNSHFINFRVDAEKEELALVEQVNVTAYPTLAWFTPQGNLIYKLEGAPQPDQFLSLGKKMSNAINAEKRRRENPDSIDALQDYLFLLHSDEPERAQQLALTFLQKHVEFIEKAEGWDMLKEYVYNPSATDFMWLEQQLDVLTGYDDFGDFYMKLYENAISEAVNNNNIGLLDKYRGFEYATLSSMGLAEHPKEYYHEHLNAVFHLSSLNGTAAVVSVGKLLQTYHKDEPAVHADWVANMLDLPFDEVGEALEKWASFAAERDPSARHILLHALVRYQANDYQKALELATSARELTDSEELLEYIDNFIDSLREEMR